MKVAELLEQRRENPQDRLRSGIAGLGRVQQAGRVGEACSTPQSPQPQGTGRASTIVRLPLEGGADDGGVSVEADLPSERGVAARDVGDQPGSG